MKLKRIAALFVIFCLVFTNITYAQTDYLTRGEVVSYLLEAADYYNPSVKREDIIKGYDDGLLHEEWHVTRAEALIMINRAFGGLLTPQGYNKTIAFETEDFYDIPSWAQGELKSVIDSGIVAGTDKKKFSPDENITAPQLELFVERVYALYGKNPCDDFYAAANNGYLSTVELSADEYSRGTIESMQEGAVYQVSGIVNEIASGNHPDGTAEQKVAALYKCIMDTETIDKNSVKPVKGYLDEIDNVKNISELSLLQETLAKELYVNPFMKFGLCVDLTDSSKYALTFATITPLMNKEVYFNDDSLQEEYITYIETLLVKSGESNKTAKVNAKAFFEFEKTLAENMLSAEDKEDIKNIYNTVSYNKLQVMFPDCDLEKLLDASCLKKEDRVIVEDVRLMECFSEMYNQSNIDVLKTAAKVSVLEAWGAILDTEIQYAEENLDNAIYGSSGHWTREGVALVAIKDVMPEYISKIYVEKYFDEESKNDVINMATDIKNVFKDRIRALSWMSEETKEYAVKKLDAMELKIGYPDGFSSYLDDVDIVSPENGGTYFKNMLNIIDATIKAYGGLQYMPVDKSSWGLSPFEVNAGYNHTDNSMVFPAAILQAPLYDKDASYEQNLGGIGYIIAHEMTHAFDSNGAMIDANGNMQSWWTKEDYEAYSKLCERVVEFYNGYEIIPAVRTNGKLTLNENIADLGAAACIVELAGKKGSSDYKTLFTSMANSFVTVSTREYAEYASKTDTHAGNKARINCVVVHLDEFYEAFDIKEGDGMYIPPEERITIW